MLNELLKSPMRTVYYPVIQKIITECTVVQETLRYSNIEVFVICMIVYPLTWNIQKFYENHIIMIGTFHVLVAYFR